MKIVVDIWGGHHSQEHLARFMREPDDALEIARQELRNGFLVNLRQEIGWGDVADFDNRISVH